MWVRQGYWQVAGGLRRPPEQIGLFKVDSGGKRRLLLGCHLSVNALVCGMDERGVLREGGLTFNVCWVGWLSWVCFVVSCSSLVVVVVVVVVVINLNDKVEC